MIKFFEPTDIKTCEEVAEILKLKPSAIRQYVHKNEIPFFKLGKGKKSAVRFAGYALNLWLNERIKAGEKQSNIINLATDKSEYDIKTASAKTVNEFDSFIDSKIK